MLFDRYVVFSTYIEKLYKDREVRAFAESRLNELKEKAEALPKDIVWHYIGKIQSNKLKG